jgi:MOSC domain-containing protein YiiM
MMPTSGRVLSINVGRGREFDYNALRAKSAIWKAPVVGVVAARGVNLEGDEQSDRKTHGGPDKAIYLGLLPREYSVLVLCPINNFTQRR